MPGAQNFCLSRSLLWPSQIKIRSRLGFVIVLLGFHRFFGVIIQVQMFSFEFWTFGRRLPRNCQSLAKLGCSKGPLTQGALQAESTVVTTVYHLYCCYSYLCCTVLIFGDSGWHFVNMFKHVQITCFVYIPLPSHFLRRVFAWWRLRRGWKRQRQKQSHQRH